MQSSRAKIAIVAVITITALGCGKADYEAKMLTSVKDLAFGSRFIDNLHLDATQVIEGVAELRLPVYIPSDALTLTMDSRDRYRKPVDPDRIQPPGLRIPGFRYTYEMFINAGDAKNRETLCWYFATVPATEKLAAIEATIKAGAAKTVPKSRPAFVDASLDTPARKTIAYRKMSLTGTQLFNADADAPENVKRAGQFDVYIHSTETHHVIIAIRGTTGAIEAANAMDHASYALGTLKMVNAGNSADDA